MAKINSINLDTCLDWNDPNTLEFLKFLEDLNITFEILEWHGPAGGNPYIKYNGTKESLMRMALEKFDMGQKDELGNYNYEDIMEELDLME